MELVDWVHFPGLELVSSIALGIGVESGFGLGLEVGVFDGSYLPYLARSNDIALIHTFLLR